MKKMKKSSAMTLLEIMVALIVLSVILMGAFKALTVIKRVQQKSEELSIASRILSEAMENIIEMSENGGYDMIDLWQTYSVENIENQFPMLKTLNNSSLAFLISNYNADGNVKHISITINWTSPDGAVRNESFQTIVSRPPGY